MRLLALLLLLPTAALGIEILNKPIPERQITDLTLDLGGFVQPRFNWVESDADITNSGELGFSVARMRLEFKGRFEHQPVNTKLPLPVVIRHKLSVEFMPEARLQDAWVELGAGSIFRFRAGQQKAPTNRSFLVSDRNTIFPERSQLDTMIPRREMGASVVGYVGRRHIEYQAGLFNGEGTNRLSNVNRKLLYAARVAVSPLGSPGTTSEVLQDGWTNPDGDKQWPTVTFGYSWHFNEIGPPGQQLGTMGHNAELFFHYRFVTVQGEFLYRVADAEDLSLDDFHQAGGYLQFALFPPMVPWVQDHIAVTFRYEQFDRYISKKYDLPLAGTTDPAQHARDIHIGLNFYWGKPLFLEVGDLRVNVNYVIKQELENQPFKNNELIFALHFAL